ncbi:HK97 family phage portal protein [Loktanella ponticola]|uniref:HK97 family phage portal protein n=1 Tax=Yoonia ponticola TaxID=1524255 RepID=A0A7W9BMR7_9RHOB|nr:phage portal protein [Yoonia ponticola]MBB5723211.1 HK97 family phage portal protein [Yoonia ponticola]
MTILSRLFGNAESKALHLTDPDALGLFGAIPTATGIHVSGSSALRVPAVACAAALISETIGAMPAKVHLSETKEAVKDQPAYRLVHDEANEWTSAGQLREDLTIDALLTDNGYAHVVRLDDGTPVELHRLDPATVQTDYEPDGEPFYIVQTTQGPRRYSYRDILHIQPFGGLSPIKLGREAIALSLAFEQHVASLFANGARPSGIIKSEKALDVEAKKKIAGSWFSTHSGRNTGGTAILDEGMTYDQLSMTLADAQFAENRLEQIREIARVFRVPPTMLFELTRGTWSNTEEMARQFHAITLKPWLVSWAWAYARVLFTPEERAAFYIEFVTDDLLTTNSAARAAAYGQYRSMGAMTANEVRGGLNLAPRPDGNNLANPYTTSGAPDPAIQDQTA